MEFIQFLVESARPQYREERKLYVQKERLQAIKMPLGNFIELSCGRSQKRRNYIALAKFQWNPAGQRRPLAVCILAARLGARLGSGTPSGKVRGRGTPRQILSHNLTFNLNRNSPSRDYRSAHARISRAHASGDDAPSFTPANPFNRESPMKKSLLHHLIIGSALFVAISAAPAYAQTRTWVSATGDDGFPCSRTAPCKTFAGALIKTAAGGEISVMDSGGFGQVTINKAITINGEGNLAHILASGGTGINIAAGVSDQVIIRNLSINGAGGGNNGIFISSGNVTIDKCLIYGFTTGFFGGVGINVAGSSSITQVDIRDTDIANVSHGVLGQTSGSSVVMGLDNVRINNATGIGVAALSNNVFISVRNSFVRNAASSGISTSGGAAVINVVGSTLVNNGTAVNAAGSGSTIRLSDVSMFDNNTGLAISNGATIATAANNKTNNQGAATNGTVTNF
jgi:hypothetical protein